MKFIPLAGRALVEMAPLDEHWDAAGVLVRPDIGREMPMRATVRALGKPSLTKKNSARPLLVAVGDAVLVPWATGQEISIGGVRHRAVAVDDIMAVVE